MLQSAAPGAAVAKAGRERVFVDTNVFLRFLTADDPAKAQRCRALFERAERRELDLVISDLVLGELAWTLRSYYRQPREAIAATLTQILDMRSIRIPQRATWREAVALYSRHNVDLVDAYHAAQMGRRRVRRIFSYDTDFDQLGLKRQEP